jgi:hypothetical protein
MRKIFLLFFLLVIFLIPSSAQQGLSSLTDKDKAFIIKSILLQKDFLNRGLIAGENREFVNLSLENIAPELLPKIRGINFVLFNREQIEEKIKTGFMYYAFGHFKITDGKVLIDFGHYFENIKYEASYSGGLIYECQKIRSKWKCVATGGFGSNT